MIMPGDRVLVFDSTLFRDDKSTPISFTVRPATVLRRYGKHSCCKRWTYPDLVDVLFDHRPKQESKGHFTNGVKSLAADVNNWGEADSPWVLPNEV